MSGITSAVSYQPADLSRPVLETTVGGVLREAGERAAGTVALVEGTPDASRRRWSYADLLSASEGVARALLGRFAPGERVAVWAPNSPEWLLAEFGAALAGLTLVTVNPALRAHEVAHVLGHSRQHGVVLAPAYRGTNLHEVLAQVRGQLPGLREVISLADWDSFVRSGSPTERLPDVGPDDDAQIQYTSGTTGLPKGSVLRHRGSPTTPVLRGDPAGRPGGRVGQPDAAVSDCRERAVHAGTGAGPVHPGPGPGLRRRAGAAPDRVRARHHVRRGAHRPARPGRPHRVRGGRAVVHPVRADRGLAVHHPDPARRLPADRAETLGRPHPQVEVRITDPATGETLPAGAVGEILTRGYHVMKAYFGNPEATAETVDMAAWLHTGDLGSMDERGYCRIEGRLKEMIIRGGENIYPRGLEQLLHAHPGVADAAVVGVPDDYWGEQVAAFVTPAPGSPVTQDELASYCRAHLASHKTPRHWVFVDAIPLTPSGKVQKFVLREQFTSDATPAAR